MLKKLYKLRNKKGFTLVECVVAMAVFVLMATVVMQLLALSIQTYTHNDRIDKGLDVQLEYLVKNNNLQERESFDFAVEFLNPDDSSAGAMSVTGIKVNRLDVDAAESSDERLENIKDELFELNTLEYSIAGDVGTSSEPTSSSSPDSNTLNVVKNYMHIYGSMGFDNVIASEDPATTLNGDTHTIIWKFKLNDSKGVLGKSPINSIKVALPEHATDFRPAAGTPDLNILILGHTIRMNLPQGKEARNTYEFTIQFNLKDEFINEYGSFEKYFLNSDTPSTDKSETFVENINALGVYNIKAGTVQVKE